MVECNVEFKVDTFPNCDKFYVFRVYNNCIWQTSSVPAFNIDTGYIEYYDLIFDDPVTANVICEVLNYEEVES